MAKGRATPHCACPLPLFFPLHHTLPCTITQVEVSWEGVPDPQDTDLLAVYSPPDAFAHGASPIKFANCSEAPHHVARGSGTLALRLVNVRADWRVVFVRLAPDGEPLLSAAGPVLRNAAPNEPTGVHLLASGSHT